MLTSKCASDPVFTSAQISNCELGRKHGCTAEYDAFLLCGHDKARCTTDGKTDGEAQLVDCKAEYDTFMSCIGPASQPDAGRDGG